jgi:hypothetical protein
MDARGSCPLGLSLNPVVVGHRRIFLAELIDGCMQKTTVCGILKAKTKDDLDYPIRDSTVLLNEVLNDDGYRLRYAVWKRNEMY